jgi:cell division protein FtsI (penicillin-binding protein 3)
MRGRVVAYSSSPLLASRTPVWRSKLIVAGIALAFVGLAGRAAWVQVFGNAFYIKQGEVRFARTLELPANRGRIFDRNGLLLATSVPVPSIWASPEDVERDPTKLARLAKLLDMPLAELMAKLEDQDRNFVWLKRQVDDASARQIAALDLKGIFQRKEYRRQYPEGEAAAHIVGFTSVEDKGQEGVELAFDKDLAGRPGLRHVIKDRLGHIVEDVGQQVLPVDGKDLQLSIDSKVQFFAYQKLREAVVGNKAKAGSVVVLDARTGEVLALANYPSYSPSNRQNLTGAQLRNRALTDTFEPGSTMKPLVVSLALEKGLVKSTTVIPTAPGRMTIGGSTISDSHPHGDLTVAEVIQKSSNVGTVKLAMQLQPREMWDLYTQVGLGQRPQVHFPGVVSGKLRAWKTWKPIEQATMSYGYGLSTSLFQLARAYTVFARDGELIPLTLMKSDVPATGVRVLQPSTALQMRQMLHLVTINGGTAPRAQTMGYSVGGKTGTAYKQEGRGYAEHKYRSVFVGIAPIDQPRIVVAVMVDEPSAGRYYGGDVAAPVFSATVQQTLRMLGVQPDMNVKPQIVVDAVEESF